MITFLQPLTYYCNFKKVGATRTIRTNRKWFPKELLRKDKLKRGEYKYSTSNHATVVKWQDKKPVFISSNVFDPRTIATISRKGQDGSKQVISQYNKYKGGVDVFD